MKQPTRWRYYRAGDRVEVRRGSSGWLPGTVGNARSWLGRLRVVLDDFDMIAEPASLKDIRREAR